MANKHSWGTQEWLNMLLPPLGTNVELAIFLTYSLDLKVAASALLTLAGYDLNDSTPSAADFTRAILLLKEKKVRMVHQAGRLSCSGNSPESLRLLDQFLTPQQPNENTHSWHPKGMLLKFSPSPGQTGENVWRFWMGSRNMTGTLDLEAGLLLTSSTKTSSKTSSCIALNKVAKDFVHYAGKSITTASIKGIEKVYWELPPGVSSIEDIRLFPATGNTSEERNAFFKPVFRRRDQPDKTIILSPFLDINGLTKVQSFTSTPIKLYTTPQSVAKISGSKTGRTLLKSISECRVIDDTLQPEDTPPNELFVPGTGNATDEAASGGTEEQSTGLHAKIIALQWKDFGLLWMGSANLTGRGFERNAELVARMKVHSSLLDSLRNRLAHARLVDIDALAENSPPSEPTDLHRLRNEIAACTWKLEDANDQCKLLIPQNLPNISNARLTAALLGLSQLCITPAQKNLLFNIPANRTGGFVNFTLGAGLEKISWLQQVEFAPPQDRDETILAEYLGARNLYSLLRSLLGGFTSDDDSWDTPRSSSRPPSLPKLNATGNSFLEELLYAWQQDPKTIKDVVRRATQLIKKINQANKLPEEFTELWNAVQEVAGR